MKIKIGVFLLCFMAFLASATAAPQEAQVKEASFTDPNKMIQVTQDSPRFSLRIKSNPTTGYSWFLVDYNANVLTPISREYHRPDSDMVGASGYEIWTFAVHAKAFSVPQMTSVTLQSVRPWVVTPHARKMTFSIVLLESKI